MERKKKILITGGHVTPALAVIDRLTERKYEGSIVFVGRKYTSDTEKTVSFEYQEVIKRNIPFIHLEAGRLTRIFSLRSLKHALKIPLGFYSAWRIMAKEKPDVILSFGGYLALPVAYAAKMQKIPIYTHEQTAHPGLANRIISKIATQTFVSFPESIRYFRSKQIVCTGNPLRKSIFNEKKLPKVPPRLPIVYVTGGSLGAHAINQHIEHILPLLLKRCIVIHQTGNVKEYGDFERLTNYRNQFPSEMKERYIIKQHVGDDEIGAIYAQADVVVARSGANTFFELIALKKPVVFIPLPWAAHDEQREHALLFKKQQAGLIFEQSQESSELLEDIFHILDHKSEFTARVAELSHYHKEHADDQIIDTLLR